MSIRIFHARTDLKLAEFATAVFDTLDIEDREERDSDNYPGGTYYRGRTGAITVRISPESDTGWEDFQQWVVLDADLDAADFEALCAGMVLRLLATGFPVAREVGHTDAAITREIYSLSDGTVVARQEQQPVAA